MKRTLKLLIFSDLFVLTGFGLVSPILAIFIKENIGATLAAVGIASTITIMIRCSLQLLFGFFAKAKHRYYMAVCGTLLIASVPFLYFFAENLTWIYVAATINGIGAGLANPAWFSLFAGNLDKNRRGWEWSIYSSSVGFGTAFAALGGSALAGKIGFRPVFLIVGILCLVGCGILLQLFAKEHRKERQADCKETHEIVSAKIKLNQNPLHAFHH